jgi:hypothetical protein
MQALVAVYLIGKLTGKLFFGSLRPAESEVFILYTLQFYYKLQRSTYKI